MLRLVGALGLTCLFFTGCVDPQKRLELAEEAERKRDLDVRIVADVAVFDNTAPLQVHGVGLVTGLQGTGHSPAGYYRGIMEQYLLKNRGPRGGELRNLPNEQSVRKILDNPDNCLVIVKAEIPPGARKGDRFDADVSLPDGSKAISLAGGQLLLTWLRVYQAKSELSARHESSNQLVGGHVLAHAKGPLVVGFGGSVDLHELKRGKVWLGGTSRIHRPYALIMRNDDKSVRIANGVAERINFMYQDDPHSKARHADFTVREKRILLTGAVTKDLNHAHDPTGMSQTDMAKAASKDMINVRVPFAYRFDHGHFLHVASVTPLRASDPKLMTYRKRLKNMLLDPKDTILSARRLEAMGRDSIDLLKPGLQSDHPLVRFASAESLAYLGSTLGVEELAQLPRKHPILARHCTLALANLGESICRQKLGAMLVSDDRALRCAAFHALSLLDEEDPRLGGQFVNEAFWLYRIPGAPSPMVFYSTSKRPQVVLFGRNIQLAKDTRLIVGDYTVVCTKEGDKIQVKRITLGRDPIQPVTCSTRLDDVLAALTDLGATYADVVTFLRLVNDRQYANYPVVSWTVPEVALTTIIQAGREMKNGE
ncbi:MAG: flagellar basal body P-ring protein FlgI [Planctomycetes bacterium]|nr:flagellar basal body P-ring protein FlgI [Planctomycetota bacterium]